MKARISGLSDEKYEAFMRKKIRSMVDVSNGFRILGKDDVGKDGDIDEGTAVDDTVVVNTAVGAITDGIVEGGVSVGDVSEGVQSETVLSEDTVTEQNDGAVDNGNVGDSAVVSERLVQSVVGLDGVHINGWASSETVKEVFSVLDVLDGVGVQKSDGTATDDVTDGNATVDATVDDGNADSAVANGLEAVGVQGGTEVNISEVIADAVDNSAVRDGIHRSNVVGIHSNELAGAVLSDGVQEISVLSSDISEDRNDAEGIVDGCTSAVCVPVTSEGTSAVVLAHDVAVLPNTVSEEVNEVGEAIDGTTADADMSGVQTTVASADEDANEEGGKGLSDAELMDALRKRGFVMSMELLVSVFGDLARVTPVGDDVVTADAEVGEVEKSEPVIVKYVGRDDRVYDAELKDGVLDKSTCKPSRAGEAYFETEVMLNSDELRMLELYRAIHKAGFGQAKLKDISISKELEYGNGSGVGIVSFDYKTQMMQLMEFTVQSALYMAFQYEKIESSLITNADKCMSMYRHIVEFSDFDEARAFEFYKEYRSMLWERRDIKDTYEMLSLVLQSLSDGSQRLSIEDFVKRLRAVQTKYMSCQSNRKSYTPKVKEDVFRSYLGVREGHFSNKI